MYLDPVHEDVGISFLTVFNLLVVGNWNNGIHFSVFTFRKGLMSSPYTLFPPPSRCGFRTYLCVIKCEILQMLVGDVLYFYNQFNNFQILISNLTCSDFPWHVGSSCHHFDPCNKNMWRLLLHQRNRVKAWNWSRKGNFEIVPPVKAVKACEDIPHCLYQLWKQ